MSERRGRETAGRAAGRSAEPGGAGDAPSGDPPAGVDPAAAPVHGIAAPAANGAAPAGPPPLTHRQTMVVLSALLLGMLLAALTQMIVSTALPTIVGDLHGIEHMSWVVTSYLLASTVAMPLYGKLGDLYGRRPVYLAGILIFLIGSILCGLAQSMIQLIAFRAVQGLGGGGLMLTAMAAVGDVVQPRERGRYQGLFGVVFGLASIVGPLVGGFVTDHFDWRWIFFINLPLGAVTLVVTFAVLKLPKPTARPRIDYLGALLVGAAVTCIVLFTSLGGTEYAWRSAPIICLAAGSVVLLVLFALVERAAAEPIIPLHLFRNQTVSASSVVSLFIGFAMFGCIAFMPLFLQIVSNASATNSGLLLLPFMGGMIATSMIAGVLTSRTGKYRIFPLAGSAVAAVGMFLLSTMDSGTSLLVSGVYLGLLGGGIGLVMQTVVLASQNTVDHRDLGTATSTVSFTRQIGGSFGVAFFGAIFNSRLSEELATRLPGAAGAKLPSTSSVTREMIEKLPPQLREVLVTSFANALTDVFLLATPALVLGFLAALWLREEPLRGAGEPAAAPAASDPGARPARTGDEGPVDAGRPEPGDGRTGEDTPAEPARPSPVR